ncbi:glycosyltransferase family 87 protein [Streptomyces sp. I05A-00742]|uniref:glycosyltransferase family 87 protein n=1 Tax=Streptomyces sp. I05A-00742 TaxID=2732853 RepID=UPI0014898F00|nr:glycosyltransferase 87 family protein [Streptomyces sp. I05A-00742]
MRSVRDGRLVRPTQEDKVAAAGSELVGGPAGRRALPGGWRTPVRVIVLVMIGMFALGMVQKLPCYNHGWFFGATTQYTHACYSDIPHLFAGRGFDQGLIPYLDEIPRSAGDMDYLEYPVLTGLFMEVAALLTPGGSSKHEAQLYWFVNAGMLLVCAVVIAYCTARTHRRRPWDGLLVALAPAFALTATINWDLFAVALTAGAMLAWSRGRAGTAGLLIGLAAAAKLYPVLLLWPLFLLCWRAGRWKEFRTSVSAAVIAWLVVNVPLMLVIDGPTAPIRTGWAKFYTFSQERPVDYGSLWLLVSQRTGDPLEDVNTYATVLMALGALALGALCLYAPRRPRFAQLVFLVVALFVLTNKVYSPQYVLWLIPLVVLARPKWRDFLIWQTCEVLYFLAIWFHLAYTGDGDKHQGLPPEGYQLAIVLHLLGTLYLCVMVVRDVLRPDRDVIRRDGSDDPSGGVLDGAPDAFVLGTARGAGRTEERPEAMRVQWGTGSGGTA